MNTNRIREILRSEDHSALVTGLEEGDLTDWIEAGCNRSHIEEFVDLLRDVPFIRETSYDVPKDLKNFYIDESDGYYQLTPTTRLYLGSGDWGQATEMWIQ